jgi:outer membrane lipoprotein-sorting protein
MLRTFSTRFLLLTISSAVLSMAAPSLALGSIPADEILRRADGVRNPGETYLMKVEVTSKDADKAVFEVSLSGNSKTFIKTLEPARDRGRNLLMLGEDMWVYMPNLKRSVRVSLSQKLTGQAANGDLSRMRWSGDYDATIESESDKSWTLFLSAKRKGLTYDKIRAVIEKNTFHPLAAEFLTPSGKPLKRATYGDFKPLLGRVRPHTMKVQDAIRPDDVSVIRVTTMEVKSFPASLFNQNSLR